MARVRLHTAIGIAFVAHVVCLIMLSPASSGTSSRHQLDVVFWGGILRSQDLMPLQPGLEERSDVHVIAPMAFIRSAQMGAWKFGSSVEKPEQHVAVSSQTVAMAPDKFLTEKVMIDEPQPARDLGLPVVAPISLKERP